MRRLLPNLAILAVMTCTAHAAETKTTDPRPAQIGITFTVHHGGSPAAPSTWLRVEQLTPGAAAERAGVRAGDIITELNGQPLAFSDEIDLLLALAKLEVDKPATFTIIRGRERRTVTLLPTRMSTAQYEQWKVAVSMLQAQRAQRAAIPPSK